jgi:hypothetical protein
LLLTDLHNLQKHSKYELSHQYNNKTWQTKARIADPEKISTARQWHDKHISMVKILNATIQDIVRGSVFDVVCAEAI